MGNEQYVFVSYAHRDAAVVLPCLEVLKQKKVSIWYDEGIQAGSEWPEYIAEKVVNCSKFILFISRAYLESQNCKRELNFAISRKKDLLSVFIEDVQLSPGVEMQLGTYQSIFKNRFSSDEVFRESLSNESWFNSCREGAPPAPQATANAGAANWQQPAPQQPTYQRPAYQPQQPQRPAYQPPVTQPRQPVYNPEQYALPVKNRIVAALLAIFLCMWGLHHFYLRNYKRGVLSLLFCWTYIPLILNFLDGLRLLVMPNEQFAIKYRCRVIS